MAHLSTTLGTVFPGLARAACCVWCLKCGPPWFLAHLKFWCGSTVLLLFFLINSYKRLFHLQEFHIGRHYSFCWPFGDNWFSLTGTSILVIFLFSVLSLKGVVITFAKQLWSFFNMSFLVFSLFSLFLLSFLFSHVVFFVYFSRLFVFFSLKKGADMKRNIAYGLSIVSTVIILIFRCYFLHSRLYPGGS